jgi:hypothetical protein
MVATMMHRMMLGHRLRRDRFCAIRSRFRIASRLLYPARRRLSLRRRSRCLLGRSVSASCRLVSLVGRINGALCWIRLVRRTSREQRKGQYSPGKHDQFRSFSH